MKTFRILVAMAVIALAGKASAQTLTTLYTFSGGSNGANPYARLVQGSDGNFYGTTVRGGSNNTGTVFRISSGGTFTNLHSFSGSDGATPYAGLVQGSDGNFYGTTYGGGASNLGAVFRITPNGSFTNLHSFSGAHEGLYPKAPLVQGSDGNFYGTTYRGGPPIGAEDGTIFRIDSSGSLTNLHNFNNGALPSAPLVQGSDGNFYGTTAGTNSSYGTVYRISSDGTFTNLHTFSSVDGAYPSAGLVQGSDGYFYGTTVQGGGSPSCSGGCGTVFKISSAGSFTTLYVYVLTNQDAAAFPNGLIQGSDGNLYGTTRTSFLQGMSTVFAISTAGAFTNLFNFYYAYYAHIDGELVQGNDGAFYGVTYDGGTNFLGTVFKLSVPLNPPANQVSSFQPAGSNFVFTIPSVASETYQLQFTTDLVTGKWLNVVGVCVSNSIGAGLTVTNFGGATGPQGFYRFAITP